MFKIDIETCEHCGGAVKMTASIDESAVVKRILDHLHHRSKPGQSPPHPSRGPPLAPALDPS